MIEHDRKIIHSSNESDWRTPPACYAALCTEFHFGLDAAADETSALAQYWLGPGGLEPDALVATEWSKYATWPDESGALPVFLNPPFSRTKARQWEGGEPLLNPYRIENWARKCWEESQKGCTIVGLFPFAPQTDWYRYWVYGQQPIAGGGMTWRGHAAQQERRLPHRISFLRPDGSAAGNAGVNTAVIVWSPMRVVVGPWLPHSFYWSFR